jgi:hypothetical protein
MPPERSLSQTAIGALSVRLLRASTRGRVCPLARRSEGAPSAAAARIGSLND